ncbi:uncharacterized protein F5147DRAFT_671130 [Suillus discolor]|uniref:Secreted protein n=1 Tax=Suillus discolor TaxID=1912936 RepID=A0A9P7FGI9_9AGAM|nr:uncharacterized protein F5147DRAFT_671130 [Suillus discolor]KAG2117088.1 hypothetical protein F5147DRAFT_671130 [Suillus discolor]
MKSSLRFVPITMLCILTWYWRKVLSQGVISSKGAARALCLGNSFDIRRKVSDSKRTPSQSSESISVRLHHL